MAKISELKYGLLQHSPYSPGLAPFDFWLFSHLKKFIRGKRFSSNEEVIAAVGAYFNSLPVSHFRDGIHKLKDHWNKSTEVQGDYIE